MENVIAAEGEIIEKLRENKGTLYCNRDDQWVREIDYSEAVKVVRY